MSEIRIDDQGIYFDYKIGITKERVMHALAHPEELPALYEQVQAGDPELDISFEEFLYFLRHVDIDFEAGR